MAKDYNKSIWKLNIILVILGVISIVYLIYSDYLKNLSTEKSNDIQNTQIALNRELYLLEAQKATAGTIQTQTIFPQKNPESALTFTAIAYQSTQLEATRQAADNRQYQINATQTVIANPLSAMDCTSAEYTPPLIRMHPEIGILTCIPSGVFAWISSDPARFTIPGVYDKPLGSFTFALFGPVRFTISGVESRFVWLDASSDLSLLDNNDGKSLSLVFRDGKVCQRSAFNGSSCP